MGLTVVPRTKAELLEDWIPVSRELPKIGKPNGYWDSISVTIAQSNGRVVGAFFTYEEGFVLHEGKAPAPVPSFQTDEGLGYKHVTHWQYLPKHPKDLK